VPLNPDEIDSELLPRSSFGSFKPGPVEELLKRVAWDYRQLLHDNRQQHAKVAELQARAEELERQLEAMTKEAQRKQPDELARQALAAAQRAARELRDSARQESELALKKAHTRAERIYRDNARASAELRELHELRGALEKRLRSVLTTALAQVDDSIPAPRLDAELVGRLDSADSGANTAQRQKKGQTPRV
jgi:cell division septum initiation protein DivIVA